MFAARYLNNSKVKCNFENWHKNDYERLNCEKKERIPNFFKRLQQIVNSNKYCTITADAYNQSIYFICINTTRDQLLANTKEIYN